MENQTTNKTKIMVIQQEFSEKKSGGFGQYENSAKPLPGIARQVSTRIQKGPSLVGKRLAKDSWHEAADKVRVNVARFN